jgi:hypothetical protein
MPKRIQGKLQSFSRKRSGSGGYVRLSNGDLLHLPVTTRGVLEDKTIRMCEGEARYTRICSDVTIVIDIERVPGVKDLRVVAWAPVR